MIILVIYKLITVTLAAIHNKVISSKLDITLLTLSDFDNKDIVPVPLLLALSFIFPPKI